MEVTREHLAGLEMALDSWNDGGPSVQFAAHLHDLIAQAKAAPGVQPVSWQFFQDGKWSTGSEFHDHRGQTESAGIPTRDLYPNVVPGVRDGYLAVPIKPTPAMLDAGVSYARYVAINSHYSGLHYMRDLWLQMLTAAPITPVPKEVK